MLDPGVEDLTVSSLEPMMLWVVEKAWLVVIVKSLLSEPNFLKLFLSRGELSLCDYPRTTPGSVATSRQFVPSMDKNL
jgi:hypothetical protein